MGNGGMTENDIHVVAPFESIYSQRKDPWQYKCKLVYFSANYCRFLGQQQLKYLALRGRLMYMYCKDS